MPGPHTLQQRVELEEAAARHIQRKKHPKRRGKRNFLVLKIAVAWILLLAAIVFGARLIWKPETTEPPNFVDANAPEPVPAEDLELLDAATQDCMRTLSGFLTASSPEERSQFVLDPIETAARMAQFYAQNPLESIDAATLGIVGRSVLHFPGARGIEVQCKSADGRFLDAAFREQRGEWRLDWDHFARYSDFPWPLFLAGSGADTGEFRLLARERLADERKSAPTISLVLYAPKFGYAKEAGFASPEFLVDRASADGRMLEAAFQLARANERPFDNRLPRMDPDGMIRIRAKIRRIEKDGRRHYEIERVAACHWYSEKVPGVDPAGAAEVE